MLKNATVLGLFAIVTVGAVTLLQQGTAERIQAAERAAQVRALGEILPTGSYDNHLLDDSVLVQDRLLGNRSPLPAYIAIRMDALRRDPPGHRSGRLQRRDPSAGGHPCRRPGGWRASHRPPGNTRAGRQDRARKEPWIRSFDGKSLTNPAADGWAVKDRGEFDQFAGATITPRAVVGAVHRALQYFDAHKAELLAAEGGRPRPLATSWKAAPSPPKPPSTHAPAVPPRDELRTTEPAAEPQGDQP